MECGLENLEYAQLLIFPKGAMRHRETPAERRFFWRCEEACVTRVLLDGENPASAAATDRPSGRDAYP
jgi:hypothetical protein